MIGEVVCVARKKAHGPRKRPQRSIRLVAGLGVEGDAHAGATVKHRSRRRQFPDMPNLRQVHLIHEELFAELAAQGFALAPAVMGENVTTRGLDLLNLPRGARLRLGRDAVVELTGLRNPCLQLEGIQAGLMAACLDRGPAGEPIRKARVMAVVLAGGDVRPGDEVIVEFPEGPRIALKPV